MSTYVLTGQQRLQLLNILPQQSGSLRESIQIKRLRDRIMLTEEEKAEIDMDPQTGGFNPQKLQDLDDLEVELSDQEREIVAGSFIKREDEGSVPTNDAFVELALKLQDEISAFRSQIDSPDDNADST
jgi:hypothetical protein